jgi:hypothetical protein
MSTHLDKEKGRGWTSCQDLNSTKFSDSLKDYVERDIRAGSIIAYLIKEDDKNIEHPIGRVLLKPFYNNKTEEWILWPAKKYGTVPPSFKKEVEKWVTKSFNKGKTGTFYIHSKVYKGTDIEGKKTIAPPPIGMKEFRRKQAELKVPMIENGQQFVDWFRNKEDWIFIRQQLRNGVFDKLIGKRVVGKPYIKKTLILSPDNVKDAYMAHYWEEKDNLRTYHSTWWVHDILGYFSKENDREMDFAWATVSLFTAYDGIEKISSDLSWDEVMINVENLIEIKHRNFFYGEFKKYIQDENDKKRLLNDFKLFWNKYVKGKGHDEV